MQEGSGGVMYMTDIVVGVLRILESADEAIPT
jgi:hypothetical protein